MNYLFTLLLTALPIVAMAQSKKSFTLDDLIPGGSTYYNLLPQNIYTEWWGDECIHLDIDKCTTIDKRTGKDDEVLFTIDDINSILTAAGKRSTHNLYYATFPYPDKSVVMIETPTEQSLVDWRQQKVVWSINLDANAGNKDWNKESRALAYTKGGNLYVTTADGNTQAVSTDGSDDIVYGESVHRNEFGIEKGTYWSPTGSLLAFYRMDQTQVSAYPQVNVSVEVSADQAVDGANTPSRCAQLVPDKYPMAGETSHKVMVGVYDPNSKSTVYLDMGDPTDRYFTNISWSPDEKVVYLIELNREQTHAQLKAYSAETGKYIATLLEEHNDKYVEPLYPIQFLPWDKSKFIYLSRRDGYNHIYLYSLRESRDKQGDALSATLVSQLTKGNFEVDEILGLDTEHRLIVYSSNEKSPIQRNVYSLTTNGKRTLLGNSDGWHYATTSPTGHYVVSNYSSPTVARRVDIVSTSTAKAVNILTADEPWDAYRTPEIRLGTLKAADGVTDLYYRLILPTDFDPAKRYPAIVYVYGGPHAHNVDASRHYGVRGWDVWMAQQGYVMFCIDNRGSERRGLAFEQATFRQLGVEEMKDQLKGVEYLKSLPYVDADRLGVHGWSFGGYMTTSLMTTYPDVFKVGVAGGPVIDWKYYEVMYGERYMDTPQTNPEGYSKTSLLGKAGNLKGRLMIIYGGNDPVCVPQHTLTFIRACIDAGTHPDLFTYPGDGHNMTGTDRVHLHEHISRYFNDFLK